MAVPPLVSRRPPWVVALAAIFLAATFEPAPAALPPGRSTPARTATPFGARSHDVHRRIDANRMNMFTTNYGHLAWDVATGSAGLVWPRGTNQASVFASGLWLGCTVNGQRRVVVAEYSSEYGPGGMVGGTFDDPNRPAYRTYKVARWTGDPADSAHVVRTPAELAADPLLDPLAHHAWSEYMEGAAPYGAPWRTYRLPNTATPDPTDSLEVPGPDVLGDQMLWCVYNDADPANHTNNAGNSTPLGVEIQQTVFAFDRPDNLGDVVFLRFRILNRGGNTLEGLHVALWSDPDLGGFTDDLVGCDVGRALGFCYNAQQTDLIYGFPPPAVGYVLLRGPLDPATGTPLGMTAFSKYIGGADPTAVQETYNYMHGLLPDGSPVIDPTTGQPTRYFHPGDPVTGQGWLDANPADRRMMITSGPSRLLPGEAQEVWAAIAMARGGDHLSSVGAVRCVSDLARNAYAQGFSPLPGPAPACSTSGVTNCPKPLSYWALECAAGGTGQLTAQQLAQVASFVNGRATLFDWPVDPLGAFCATLSPPGAPDLRQEARSEFAAFLANFAGSQLDLSIGGGQRIWLNPGTGIDCPPLRARTIGDLAAPVDLTPTLIDGAYLNDNQEHRRALAGVNWGGPVFDGGGGTSWDFFGGTLDPFSEPDSFTTVEFRFDNTPGAGQKAYRFLRLERASDRGAPPQGRSYLYGGFHPVNFTCWDATNNVQLEAAFVERCVTDDAGTILPPGSQVATFDSTWAPDDSDVGGREYLFAIRRPYGGLPSPAIAADGSIVNDSQPLLYALWARLRTPNDVIDTGDAFRFLWGRPPSPGADSLLVALEGQPLSDPAVRQAYQDVRDCLSQINAGIGIGFTCASGPTPTLVSLVSVEATADRVVVRWQAGEPGLIATVERRVEGEEWISLGRVAADGTGLLSLEDPTVIPGATYDYRLAVETAAGVEHLGEARVSVPRAFALAFLGARPNPGDGRLVLSFTLATGEPVRLELLDVAGRRVLVRDLAGLAPGSQTVALENAARLPAGIYLVVLRQGGQRVTGKAALVR